VRASGTERPERLVALARVWQRRLGVADWPASIRVADLEHEQPRVLTGGVIDLIVLAPDATPESIVATMLRYAFQSVPKDQLPNDEQIAHAARELAIQNWPKEL
jgi:hypothetical protein